MVIPYLTPWHNTGIIVAERLAQVMAETDTGAAGERGPAPYISFNTLRTALDTLRELTVDQIDRTVFSFAGGTYSQLLVAFRWFGLIDENGNIQPKLNKLAQASDSARKPLVKAALEESYPASIIRGLTRFSQKQLEDALAEFKVSGATKRKAATFLINAAQYADMQLSPLLVKKRRGPAAGSIRKRRPRTNGATLTPVVVETTQPTATTADQQMSRTVSFGQDGSITLTANMNYLKVSPRLRDVLDKLIDILDKCEAGETTTANPV